MRQKGKHLYFISQINRDGSGTSKIINQSAVDYLKEERLKVFRLSITEDTWIATDRINYYVVKSF
jgi:hypothetical protein